MNEVLLVLILYMASGQPQSVKQPMPSIEECWDHAHAFVKLDPKEAGAVAVGAGCLVKPSGDPA